MRLLLAGSGSHPDVQVPPADADAGPDTNVPLLPTTSHPHPDVRLHTATGADEPGSDEPAAVPPGPGGDAHRHAEAAGTPGYGQFDPDDPGDPRWPSGRRR